VREFQQPAGAPAQGKAAGKAGKAAGSKAKAAQGKPAKQAAAGKIVKAGKAAKDPKVGCTAVLHVSCKMICIEFITNRTVGIATGTAMKRACQSVLAVVGSSMGDDAAATRRAGQQKQEVMHGGSFAAVSVSQHCRLYHVL
jgi:hypothetical protein